MSTTLTALRHLHGNRPINIGAVRDDATLSLSHRLAFVGINTALPRSVSSLQALSG